MKKVHYQIILGVSIVSAITGIVVFALVSPLGCLQIIVSTVVAYVAYRGMKGAEVVQSSQEQLDDEDKTLKELGLSDELAESIKKYRAVKTGPFGTRVELNKIPKELAGKVIEEMKQKAEEQANREKV